MPSNSPEFERFKAVHPKAVQAGLVAAAEVYAGEVKQFLQRGYTTGDFVTGAAAASVNVSAPFLDESGAWAIRVGSSLEYTLYWELGHFNLYTKKFERVEHWRFALDESQSAMQAAFAAAYDSVMQSELG
jgi:hypothetical protein